MNNKTARTCFYATHGIVILKSPAILKLLAGENETLLVWGDTFLVLDFSFDVVNSVRALHLQSDCLASQGLHEDLHTTAQAQHQVQGRLLLDIVVSQGAAILQLLASEDQALLVGRDALFVLDLGFDIVDRVRWLDLKGDGLACKQDAGASGPASATRANTAGITCGDNRGPARVRVEVGASQVQRAGVLSAQVAYPSTRPSTSGADAALPLAHPSGSSQRFAWQRISLTACLRTPHVQGRQQ